MTIRKRFQSNTRWLLLLTLAFIISSCGGPGIDRNKVDELISGIEEEHAPDSRTALFDVSYELKSGKVVLTGTTTEKGAVTLLTNRLEIQDIPFENEINVLPSIELDGQTYAVVTNSAANIRSEPSHPAQLATQAVMGTPLTVYKNSGSNYWFFVQTPDKYLGWVDRGGITLMDSSDYNRWKETPKVVYEKVNGYIYENPDKNSRVVADVVAGSILGSQFEPSGGFVEVHIADGRAGYIPADEVSKYDGFVQQQTPNAKQLIETATQFVGFPYLWGGTTPKAFDCSGFTKTIFYLNGVMLPRDASQQVHTGKTVDTDEGFSNLKPGDLLFFGSGMDRITHVAFYMGDGQIIHAAGKVKVESINPESPNYNGDRMESFVVAKRLLKPDQKGLYDGLSLLQSVSYYNDL